MLEQATHKLNIEALPTDIPEAHRRRRVRHRRSPRRCTSRASPRPSGVTFLDDPEETIIATIVVPAEEPEEPEVEEETELVGEEAERPRRAEGDGGDAEWRATRRQTPRAPASES